MPANSQIGTKNFVDQNYTEVIGKVEKEIHQMKFT
jgi:hypothetical protein